MALFSTEVKKPFRFLPAFAWAVIIDALDFIPAVINSVLNFVGGAGIPLDLGFDGFQTVLALVIFEDPTFAIANVDFVLPAPFDLFPAYSAKIMAHKLGLVGA